MASDFSKMAKKVGRFRDNLEDEHEQATERAMKTIRREVDATVRGNDSLARRVLVSDIQHDEKQLPQFFTARSVNVPEWGKYLEHGTGARGRTDVQPSHDQYKAPDPLPPLQPILTWVIAKNLTSDVYDSKTALAEAIQQTIGDRGTFPHPFLRPVWYGTYGYRNVIDENKRAYRRAWRRS